MQAENIQKDDGKWVKITEFNLSNFLFSKGARRVLAKIKMC